MASARLKWICRLTAVPGRRKKIEMDHQNSSFDQNSQQVDLMAKADFESARRKSFRRSVFSWISKRNNQLLPFDEVRKTLPMTGQHYIGLREVEIDQIVGSVGRYQDFDRAFLPKQTHTRVRWERVDAAILKDIILPPIEVYKIGEAYFVKDGNHRVSVAREKGQSYIDAYVIEIDSPISIDANTNVDDLIRLSEKARFLAQTRINILCPLAVIELTVPGGYDKLYEHIRVHQYFMGQRRQQEIFQDQAVVSWYDEVYLPLVYVIRENQILKEFPGRTEADLYLWIIEHLYYLRQDFQRDFSLQDAAGNFTRNFSQRPLGWLRKLVNRVRKIFKRRP
jgi:hypothetical protein